MEAMSVGGPSLTPRSSSIRSPAVRSPIQITQVRLVARFPYLPSRICDLTISVLAAAS